METTVFYDGADCDGNCLLDDIEDELDIEGAVEEVVNTFLRHGMTLDDLRECYGVSDELDEIIDGYESTQEDEEEDEWLDGGREDF
jgi:hypothetical protein